MGIMIVAFVSGGTQDLQKTYNGRAGASVPAFTDAASFNLGLVTAYSGIPLSWAELGGGAYNEIKNHFTHLKQPLDTKGIYGLSEVNSKSVQAGYKFGIGLPGSHTPASANRPFERIHPDLVPLSATKRVKPAPTKPVAGHTTAVLDMFDLYERSFVLMRAEPAGEDVLDWRAQAVADPPEVNDQASMIAEQLFQAELRETPVRPARGAGTNIAASQAESPAGSTPPSKAAGIHRQHVKTAATQHQPAPPAGGRRGATGHRNDPIFIYTNGTHAAN